MRKTSTPPSVLRPESLRVIADDLTRTLVLAQAGHRTQQYASGVPYLHHVIGAAVGAGSVALELGEATGWGEQSLDTVIVVALTHDLPEDTHEKQTSTNVPRVDMTYLLRTGMGLVETTAVMLLTRKVRQAKPDYWRRLAHPSLDVFDGLSTRDQGSGAFLIERLGLENMRVLLEAGRRVACLVKIAGDTAFNSNLWKIECLYELDRDDFARDLTGPETWESMSVAERHEVRLAVTENFEADIRRRQTNYFESLRYLSNEGASVFGGRDLASELIESQQLDKPWTRERFRLVTPGLQMQGIRRVVTDMGLEGPWLSTG